MQRLRVWILVLPPVCLAALLAAEEWVLAPRLGAEAARLVVATAAVAGALAFSLVVVRLMAARDEAVRAALEAERRQAEQLEALSEATLSLTSDLELPVVLQRVVDLSRRIVGARYGALAVLSPEGLIASFHTSGLEPAVRARLGPPPQGHGLLSAVIRRRESLLLDDLTRDPRFGGFPPGHPAMRALLAVPIVYADDVIGSLYLAEDEAGRTFSQCDRRVLERFALQAAVALANARLYEAARRVSALEERHRIAMDLHDGALQSIYGVGLALQAALARWDGDPSGARHSVEGVLDRLDSVTTDLRGFLTRPAWEARRDPGFVHAMRQLLDSVSTGPEVDRRLVAQGGFTDVPRPVLWQLWHVAHEALANAVRHGSPRRIDLHLVDGGSRLQVTVQDDGAGFDPSAAPGEGHHGLANMRSRVESLDGRLMILSAPGHGTTVVADVPLAAAGVHAGRSRAGPEAPQPR